MITLTNIPEVSLEEINLAEVSMDFNIHENPNMEPKTPASKIVLNALTDDGPPPAGGTKIYLPGALYGLIFFDPNLRTSDTIFATNRPYLPHAIEVLIAYYPGQVPKITTFDWGLNNQGKPIGFKYHEWNDMNKYLINVKTEWGQQMGFASITGFSNSNQSHMVMIFNPAANKWDPLYISDYKNPMAGEWSHGYAQIEIFSQRKITIGKGMGAVDLKVTNNGQHMPLSEPKCIKKIDPLVTNYNPMTPNYVIDRWGFRD